MVSEQDVARLVEAGDGAVLVLVEGRVRVVDESELGADAYRGALRVASRADVVGEDGAGGETGSERAEIAARLNATVSNLGA